MTQIPATSIRLEPKLKEDAGAVFDDLGLSLSAAVNVFLRAVVREKGIPFDMKVRVAEQPSAETALLAPEEIAARMGPVFKSYPAIKEAYLFGSQARRSATATSDIDISITVGDDYVFSLFELSGLVRRLQEATGKKVDLLDDEQIQQMRESNPRFIKHYDEERVLIYAG